MSLQHTATHCNTLQHTATPGPRLVFNCGRQDTLQHLLQHTATHCNTLQHTATHCNTQADFETLSHLIHESFLDLVRTSGAAVYCSALQRVAACCSVLQHVARESFVDLVRKLCLVCCSVLQRVAVCCSVLQCVAVFCCSVMQCVAVCQSMLQLMILCYTHMNETWHT